LITWKEENSGSNLKNSSVLPFSTVAEDQVSFRLSPLEMRANGELKAVFQKKSLTVVSNIVHYIVNNSWNIL
jgi:hypothetical protein